MLLAACAPQPGVPVSLTGTAPSRSTPPHGRAAAAPMETLAAGSLGRRLDATARRRAAAAEQSALRHNETVTWSDPATGAEGEIQPLRSFAGPSGQTCRDYTHTISAGGRADTARGIACRADDGSWRPAS
jgi:surface antigen